MKYGDPDEPQPSKLKEKYLKAREAEVPVVSASVCEPIGSENVGNRLLQKMGWSEGQGLGKQNQGRTTIIQAQLTLFKKFHTQFENAMQDASLADIEKARIIELELRVDKNERMFQEFDQVQTQIEAQSDDLDAQMIERDNFETTFYAIISSCKSRFPPTAHLSKIATEKQLVYDEEVDKGPRSHFTRFSLQYSAESY
nr:unnamed protein product [Callosobruchus chinensis]